MDWQQLLDECVDFTQRLIQTPSMSGEEATIAALIAGEMRDLRFDEVWGDEIGNVYGRVFGRDRSLPALVLNTHLDHVDPGDPALWPVPPYGGTLSDGRIIGRGASDIKGPLAVQVYSIGALRRAGERPRRDVVFCGVVDEEIGGAGAVHWVQNLDYPVELVVLGEPSSNNLSLGHRGIIQMWVTFSGRSAHASAPERAVNPNYALAAFLNHLETAREGLASHPLLGSTTVSPTIVEVDTRSANVTPAWTRVLLDFRTAAESPRSLNAFVKNLAGDSSYTVSYDDGFAIDAEDDTPAAGFYTPPDSPLVERVRTLLGEGMGRAPELGSYRFATDGRHFAAAGLAVLGYAPGDETQAHIAGESIAVAAIDESLRGHVRLLQDF